MPGSEKSAGGECDRYGVLESGINVVKAVLGETCMVSFKEEVYRDFSRVYNCVGHFGNRGSAGRCVEDSVEIYTISIQQVF